MDAHDIGTSERRVRLMVKRYRELALARDRWWRANMALNAQEQHEVTRRVAKLRRKGFRV